MVSGISAVGLTQNERFLSCDTVLLAVRFMSTVGLHLYRLTGMASHLNIQKCRITGFFFEKGYICNL
jgi:hypothetical protein